MHELHIRIININGGIYEDQVINYHENFVRPDDENILKNSKELFV